jgi:2-methylisocitrate lyase-like PEP mutase family enzyme
MHGAYDIDEALRRLKAYEEVGADCLYVPMTASFDDLARVCAATRLPVNGLAAGPYVKVSHAEFAKIGVARISLGAALARVTHKVIHDTAKAMFDQGDFSPLTHSISGDMVDDLLSVLPRP